MTDFLVTSSGIVHGGNEIFICPHSEEFKMEVSSEIENSCDKYIFIKTTDVIGGTTVKNKHTIHFADTEEFVRFAEYVSEVLKQVKEGA